METKKICVRAEEACKMLSICRSSLFKSSIPYVKMNGCRLYRVADIESYLEKNIVHPKGENND